MPDMKFACPHCNQHLAAPPDMFGTFIACPSCNKQLQVPHSAPVARLPKQPVVISAPTMASHGDGAHGTEIVQDQFSFSLPGKWIDKTEPDSGYYNFSGPESTSFMVFVSPKSTAVTVDLLVANMVSAMQKQYSNSTVTAVTRWSGFTGRGSGIEGKMMGSLPCRCTAFGLENSTHLCVVVENAAIEDYATYARDFERIRQTFKLKGNNSEATAVGTAITNRSGSITEQPDARLNPALLRVCDLQEGDDMASRQRRSTILHQKVQNMIFWSLFVGIVYPATLFWIFVSCALFSGEWGRTSLAWKLGLFLALVVGSTFQYLAVGFALSVKRTWKWRLIIIGILVPAFMVFVLELLSKTGITSALLVSLVFSCMHGMFGSVCRHYFDQDWLNPNWEHVSDWTWATWRVLWRPLDSTVMCKNCSSRDVAPQYHYHLKPVLITLICPPIGWLMRMKPVETCPTFLIMFETYLKHKKSSVFVAAHPKCLACGTDYAVNA